MISILALYAAWQAHVANGQRLQAKQEARNAAAQQRLAEEQAKTALSRQLAAQSATKLDEALDLSLLLSVEAHRIAPTFEARSALYSALQHSPHVHVFLSGLTERRVPSVKPFRNPALAFSADGRTLASVGGLYGENVILWDIQNNQLRATLRGETNQIVNAVAVSGNGRTLAAGTDKGTVLFWDLETLQRLGTPHTSQTKQHDPDAVMTLAFSPDGGTLASGGQGQRDPPVAQ